MQPIQPIRQLTRSLSTPDLQRSSDPAPRISMGLSESLKHCRTEHELINKIKWLSADFTTNQIEKILKYAQAQFTKTQVDILFYVPKGLTGLEHTIFFNAKDRHIFIPLKGGRVGEGHQNRVKKCILVSLAQDHQSVRMIAKISRCLGFTESEKQVNAELIIKQERNAVIALNEMRILKLLRKKENVLQLIDGCLYEGSAKKKSHVKDGQPQSISKMAMFTNLFQCDLEEAINEHRLGKLTYIEKLEIAYQIAKGLASSHSLNIVHKDLKLENVLISRFKELRVVLADYGHSQFVDKEGDGLGTYIEWAPEVVKKLVDCERISNPSHPSVDMWAYGILMHEMFYGQVEWVQSIQWMIDQYTAITRKLAAMPLDELLEERIHILEEKKKELNEEFDAFEAMVREFETDEIDDSPESVIIHRLLRWDSRLRISAQEVVEILDGALRKLRQGRK
jgi:serine/threonine protein kinase